jgi:hypothetical protein
MDDTKRDTRWRREIRESRRAVLQRALADCGGNVAAAARALGVNYDYARMLAVDFGLARAPVLPYVPAVTGKKPRFKLKYVTASPGTSKYPMLVRVPDCHPDRPHYGKGFCVDCRGPRREPTKHPTCSFPGCQCSTQSRRGLCALHMGRAMHRARHYGVPVDQYLASDMWLSYVEAARGGTYQVYAPPRKDKVACAFPGCPTMLPPDEAPGGGRPHYGRGLCGTHYQRAYVGARAVSQTVGAFLESEAWAEILRGPRAARARRRDFGWTKKDVKALTKFYADRGVV